jgi:hypothetical protein
MNTGVNPYCLKRVLFILFLTTIVYVKIRQASMDWKWSGCSK